MLDTRDLTFTIAAYIADHNGGVWHPNSEPYATSELGIYYRHVPEHPDRIITLGVYSHRDNRDGSAVRHLQIRARGKPDNPDGADLILDPIATLLHDNGRIPGVVWCRRTSTAQLGQDANQRTERADNYQITLNN